MGQRWLAAVLCCLACAAAPTPGVQVTVASPADPAPASLEEAVSALSRARALHRGPPGEPMPAPVAIGWQDVVRHAASARLAAGPDEDPPGRSVAARVMVLLEEDLSHYGDLSPALAEAMVAVRRRLEALRAAPPELDWPTAPVEVSSSWGERVHPLSGDDGFHAGVDLVAAAGQPVYAAAPGEVVFAGRRGGHGNHVELVHGPRARTRYSHLSRLLVHAGQRVRRGQVIGLAGATGAATGPHLHFELSLDGVPVDPRRVVGLSAGSAP